MELLNFDLLRSMVGDSPDIQAQIDSLESLARTIEEGERIAQEAFLSVQNASQQLMEQSEAMAAKLRAFNQQSEALRKTGRCPTCGQLSPLSRLN